MEHSYRLLDPLDYLRLFYCVFFDREALPKSADRNEQIIFVIQSLVLIVVFNAAIGGVCNSIGQTFNWGQMTIGAATGILLGLLPGSLITLFSNPATGIRVGGLLAVAIGTSFGVAWGMNGGVIGSVAAGVLLGRILGSSLTGAGSAVFGVVFGLAGGIARGMMEVRRDDSILLSILALIAGLVVSLVIAFFTEKIKPHSAKVDSRAGIFLLILLRASFKSGPQVSRPNISLIIEI